MKKLINSPDRLVDEALAGVALAHADLVRVDRRTSSCDATPRAGKGRRDLRRWLRPRADARRVRRARDARRRLPGRRVHVAGSGPDAGRHQGGQRWCRRAAHRQELHRRHHELRARGRAGQGRRDRGRSPSSSPTMSRSRTRSTPRVAAAWAGRSWPRRSSAPRPRRAQDLADRQGDRREGPGQRPLDGHGADLAAPCRRPASRPSTSATTRWRSAIGIHGEPGRERRKLATADEITEMLATPIIDDLPFKSGDRVLAFVNGMGGTPLHRAVRRSTASSPRSSTGEACTIARSLVGSYITSLEMAGCSITLLKLDDEFIRLWDAPVHTPALRWGV